MIRIRVCAFVSLLFLCIAGFAQSSFRGGLSGIIKDPQGIAIAGASVEIKSVATGVEFKTVTSSSGGYALNDLPLGDYNVIVTFPGFASTKVDGVRISAGNIFDLPVNLAIASSNEVIEVDANALSVDTSTQVRTFTLPKEEVTDVPINGRSFTQMVAMSPGNTTGSTKYLIDGVDNNDVYSNGAATNQGGVGGVPGTLLPLDSIEEFSTETQVSAESGGFSGTFVNVGIKSGTNKIHGTLYYFNRNEFFARLGPFTKAKNSTLLASGAIVPKKPPIHFQEYGGSIGGPFWKNRAFYFVNYERQQYVLAQGTSSQTEPSTAYVNRALALLAAGGVTPSTNPTIPMMQKLITTLWQPGMLTGPASTGNWTPPTSAAQNGFSNNVMTKLDQTLNDKNKLSERWFYGQGSQTAPLSTSQNPWYYQVAGERVYNGAVTLNSQLTDRFSNLLLLGFDYFNQPFHDANPNNGAASVGFITGLGPGNTYGQPGIQISGFDGTGGTSVQARYDYSGHATDTVTFQLGKHQVRAGGEFRRTKIVAIATGRGSSSIYTRGTFAFSGSRGYNAPSGGNGVSYSGPYSDSLTNALADFLQGEGSSATLYNGNLDRTDMQNNFDLFATDSFQLTHRLNLTYGLRWDYLAPVTNDEKDLSTFRAGAMANPLALTGGLAVIGADLKQGYTASWKQLAPRVGFSYQPSIIPSLTKGMVIRGGIGLYFDTPGVGTWLYATSLAGNPAGTRPLYNEGLSNLNIQPNVSIFPANAAASIPNNGAGGVCTGVKTATCPALAIGSVDPNFTTGNTTNISGSVEKALGPNAIMEISYVGARGRHLANSVDLNQTTYGGGTNTAVINGFSYAQTQRPYFGAYPNFARIVQASSFGSLRADAFQAYIRTRNWHSLISQLSYALSTSSGTGTIADYNNQALDYGSNAVVTNQVKAYWTYGVPSLKYGPSWLTKKWLTGGWQLTGTLAFKGAAAITATSSASCSSTGGNTYATSCSGLNLGEGVGRASLSGLPRFCPKGNCAGGAASAITATSRTEIVNGVLQWYNPYSVIAPPGCSAVVSPNTVGADCSKPLTSYYGNTGPGSIHGAPGFGDVDLSVFKNFALTEKVHAQFRGEMFNLFNHVNYAKPTLVASSTAADTRYGGLNHATNTGQITSTIGGTSAPGIAVGEPFNCQLALKLIF